MAVRGLIWKPKVRVRNILWIGLTAKRWRPTLLFNLVFRPTELSLSDRQWFRYGYHYNALVTPILVGDFQLCLCISSFCSFFGTICTYGCCRFGQMATKFGGRRRDLTCFLNLLREQFLELCGTLGSPTFCIARVQLSSFNVPVSQRVRSAILRFIGLWPVGWVEGSKIAASENSCCALFRLRHSRNVRSLIAVLWAVAAILFVSITYDHASRALEVSRNWRAEPTDTNVKNERNTLLLDAKARFQHFGCYIWSCLDNRHGGARVRSWGSMSHHFSGFGVG